MQVFFRPRFAPELVPPAERCGPGHAGLIERWCRAFGLEDSALVPEADLEDWTENAVQLGAALSTGLPVHILDRSKELGFLRHIGADRPNPAAKTIFIGATGRHDPLFTAQGDLPWRLVWPDRDSVEAARRYFVHPAFTRHAGRKVAVASIPDGETLPFDDRQALDLVCARMLGEDRGKPVDLLLKIVAQDKYGPLERLRLEPGDDAARIQRKLSQALEYSLVHLGGQRDAVLVQEAIEMRMEYRVIVIDGRPVAGAGCIEKFTPVDTKAQFGFDPRVEVVRGGGQIIDARRVAVQRYRYDAMRIARDFVAGNPRMRDFTLDLATDPRERTIVVETNPLTNYGLYALPYRRVFKAICRAAEARVPAADQAVRMPKAEPSARPRQADVTEFRDL